MSCRIAVQQAVLESALLLAAGATRREIVGCLLPTLDLIRQAEAGQSRGDVEATSLGSVRHRLIEAALWLVAGAPRDEAAKALFVAQEISGPVRRHGTQHKQIVYDSGAQSRGSAAAEMLLWNTRLAAWKRDGSGSEVTQLLDRVLATFIGESHPFSADRAVQLLAAAKMEDQPCQMALVLEVQDVGGYSLLAAHDFYAIEEHVRWLCGPAGWVGLVGGRPLSVCGEPGKNPRAVRARRDGEETLLPFEILFLRENA